MKLTDMRPFPAIRSEAQEVIEYLIYNVAKDNDILKSECDKLNSLVESLADHMHEINMQDSRYKLNQTMLNILIELKMCYFKSLFEVIYDPSMDDYELMVGAYDQIAG